MYEAGGFGGEAPERPQPRQDTARGGRGGRGRRGRSRKGKEPVTAPVRQRRQPSPTAESSSEDEAPVVRRQSARKRFQGKITP